MNNLGTAQIEKAEVTFTRPQPPEWPRLTEVAKTVTGIEAPDWRNPVVLSELGLEIDQLSRTELINNKYYALGHLICNFAHLLQDPQTRQDIVTAGAKDLVKVSATANNGGISALQESFDSLDAYSAILDKAYDNAGPDLQLLSNYLSTAFNYRFMGSTTNAVSETMTRGVALQMNNICSPNARLALNSLTVSPVDICFKVLNKSGIKLKQGEVPTADQMKLLRDPSTVQVARRLCTILSGQSFGNDGEVIEVEKNEVRYIPPKHNFPTYFSGSDEAAQNISKDYAHLEFSRKTPMVCPALHVKGVVPLVMGMTVDMIDEARKMLNE